MRRHWVIYLLFVPAVLIGILGIIVFFIEKSFLIGYDHYKF